jgi:glycosyltransferase involved in cell wall biosynthesis
VVGPRCAPDLASLIRRLMCRPCSQTGMRVGRPRQGNRQSPRGRRQRIAMLLENNPYPQDVRVRSEAESLVRAGHEVTVIAPRVGAQPRDEVVNGVRVVRFRLIDGSTRGAAGFVLEYTMAAVALHREAVRALVHGATVLHIHNPPDVFFPAGALYRLAGRTVIFDHHDLFPETIAVKLGSPAAARLAELAERLTLRVANHVIVTNESYAEVARRDGGKRLADITVVRNGPPAAWTRVPARPREGPLDEVALVYLGAISAQDGVEGLAPILARLTTGSGSVGASLTIVGDGDARPALTRALAEHGVLDRVQFAGRVPPDRVPEFLQAADVCVDPAPATDVNARSTMTKIAEYLALGKPVVAYDLLETRRTAADSALLVAPGDVGAFADAIARIAQDPVLRHDLEGRARSRAESLTWEHSERALLAVYERLS